MGGLVFRAITCYPGSGIKFIKASNSITGHHGRQYMSLTDAIARLCDDPNCRIAYPVRMELLARGARDFHIPTVARVRQSGKGRP